MKNNKWVKSNDLAEWLKKYITNDEARIKNILNEMEVVLPQSDVSGQLLAFLQWMKENKHRYMITDEKRFVEEFLKASNLR
mgnify:CR=1 FL=1